MAENLKYVAWARNFKSDISFLRRHLSERGLLTPELDKLSNDALALLSFESRKSDYETADKYAQRLSQICWPDFFEVVHKLSQPTKIKL